MKTAKGVGLLAGILTLLHGLYLPLHFLWGFILRSLGSWRISPIPEPLTLVFIDMVLYITLGIGMIIEERQNFFLGASLWTLFGAALAAFLETYKTTELNFLSFLIVFSTSYYYAKKARPVNLRYLRLSCGVLALILGGFFLVVGLLLGFFLGFFGFLIYYLLISAVAYVILGIGIIRGSRQFLLYAILFTIIVSGVAVYSPYFRDGALSNFVSMLILFLCTYSYWGKRE